MRTRLNISNAPPLQCPECMDVPRTADQEGVFGKDISYNFISPTADEQSWERPYMGSACRSTYWFIYQVTFPENQVEIFIQSHPLRLTVSLCEGQLQELANKVGESRVNGITAAGRFKRPPRTGTDMAYITQTSWSGCKPLPWQPSLFGPMGKHETIVSKRCAHYARLQRVKHRRNIQSFTTLLNGRWWVKIYTRLLMIKIILLNLYIATSIRQSEFALYITCLIIYRRFAYPTVDSPFIITFHWYSFQ